MHGEIPWLIVEHGEIDLLHIFRNGETNTPFGLNFMLKLQCISSSILWSISAAHIPGAEYTRWAIGVMLIVT